VCNSFSRSLEYNGERRAVWWIIIIRRKLILR
jgi:hypothetical protein